jgi:FkbM family methyltransferase
MHRRTIVRLGERSRIWADLHRTGASKVAYANPPDHPEMLVWKRFLKPGDLFIDVGANVGSYTIWTAEIGADVIALEPADDTFALLTDNIVLNGYPVMALQAAAGTACGAVRFTVGLDSLNRMDPEGGTQIEMVTLDSIVGVRGVAGMKVDVEGFEIEVLRGCEQMLSERRVKLIQLEWNRTSLKAVGSDRRPVADLLAQYGYNLFRPDRHGTLIPAHGVDFGLDMFAQPFR